MHFKILQSLALSTTIPSALAVVGSTSLQQHTSNSGSHIRIRGPKFNGKHVETEYVTRSWEVRNVKDISIRKSLNIRMVDEPIMADTYKHIKTDVIRTVPTETSTSPPLHVATEVAHSDVKSPGQEVIMVACGKPVPRTFFYQQYTSMFSHGLVSGSRSGTSQGLAIIPCSLITDIESTMTATSAMINSQKQTTGWTTITTTLADLIPESHVESGGTTLVVYTTTTLPLEWVTSTSTTVTVIPVPATISQSKQGS